MKNKTCNKCNQKKSINKFYVIKGKIDYYCKECRKAGSLKSHRGNVRKSKCTVDGCERFNYAKTLCRIHYERMRRNGGTDLINKIKESYGKYPSMTYIHNRKNRLKYKYKITLEKYEEMAKNGCEVCGENPYEHKILHLDHDHNCCPVNYINGKAENFSTCGLCVRGVLCNKCNAAVGRYEKGVMREDYPLRDKIITYVAKYNQIISDRIYTYDKEQGNR